MKTRLFNIWEYVTTGFWFVPSLMTIMAIAMALGLVAVDESYDLESLPFSRFLYIGSPEGTREILSTIASSMITVAGVVFSITIVALTLASSQFGPHLLRNFIRNTGNQVVLGTFIATYIYCLLVLRSVQSVNGSVFVPSMAATVALALALISVGVLIYFIHHVSASIQADSVIAEVYGNMIEKIREQFPEHEVPHGEANVNEVVSAQQQGCSHWAEVTTDQEGYLQAIDYSGLLSLACKHEVFIHLSLRPGKPVERAGELARIYGTAALTPSLCKQVRRHFILGPQPTPEQDVEFAVRQLVQIAVRALSPGINDPFTAMTCIDWLGFAMASIAERWEAAQLRCDEQGNPRLLVQITNFTGVMDAAFDQIRQAGQTHVSVCIRMLESFATIAKHCRCEEQKNSLRRHGEMVWSAAHEANNNENDRRDLRLRYDALLTLLDG